VQALTSPFSDEAPWGKLDDRKNYSEFLPYAQKIRKYFAALLLTRLVLSPRRFVSRLGTATRSSSPTATAGLLLSSSLLTIHRKVDSPEQLGLSDVFTDPYRPEIETITKQSLAILAQHFARTPPAAAGGDPARVRGRESAFVRT
jgi:hypothetical protein